MDEEFDTIFVPDTGKYRFDNGKGVCNFSKIVECHDKSKCNKCGWNPVVAELRSQEIRRRLGIGNKKKS